MTVFKLALWFVLVTVTLVVAATLAGPPVVAQKVVLVGAGEEPDDSDARALGVDVAILDSSRLPEGVVDGVRLTVGEVTRPCLDPWLTPPAESQWVCYLITIYNLADDSRAYGPEQFFLIFDDGAAASPTFEGSIGDGLRSGLLPPGGAVAGVLRFMVPTGVEARAFRFDPADGRDALGSEIPL